jgi:hypothetical protein
VDELAAGGEAVRAISPGLPALALVCPQPAMTATTPMITGVAKYGFRT